MNEITGFLEQLGMNEIIDFLEQPGVLFVVFGLVVVISMSRKVWRTLSFWRRAQSADGTVTDLREKWTNSTGSSGRHKVSYPVLRFTTQDGREVQTETDPSPVKQGAQVSVYYDPDDPTEITLTRFGSEIISTVSAFPAGLFLIIQGMIIMGESSGTGSGSMLSDGTVFRIISRMFSLFPFIFGYVGLVAVLSSIPELRLARQAGGTGDVISGIVKAGVGLFFVGIGLWLFSWFPFSVI